MTRFRPDLRYSDITPKDVFLNRRSFLASAAAAGIMAGSQVSARDFAGGEEPNTFEEITSYNNFYEFGTDKGDPARYASALTTDPWSIKVDGLVDRPGTYDIADLVDEAEIEERIYRFRCVEAWSMVIPWNGIELSKILAKFGPQPGAKYVAFETLVRPEEMRGQAGRSNIDWPYREGLRMDEAMHPLTLMGTGIYGEPMPKQNGAPIRLVVPWKYGFKSIKSIVRISFTAEEPPTTWNMLQPREYGFYANVNPQVDHPRWSQATERRIGGGLLARRRPTLMLNGYADQVADLYTGMDLTQSF
ncbi:MULTISPECIES: protein-methionine-sulfoxide reductase catalytic subunit MsrP [unclassified Dinoroseobacter]|uniref:protein-methionine-sulfoxide reductase catalytic subunit MsrP n=1 Tax=unclassified Dinoroseobacter TaxID=2620028 RepID=UPI003C7C8627